MQKQLLFITTFILSFSHLIIAQDSTKILNEVVISASRIEEKILKTPVTVTKITSHELENSPSVELFSSLAHYKGIDVSQSSFFITSLSTRGFNSSKSERILQLADGVDFMSPTSSLYGGNWMGISALDLEDIEITYGANSALYGSGAFNGVIMEHSKNPFKTTGLTVSLKTGNRNLFDVQLRYATTFGKRFAFKVNTNYTEADEFIGNSDAAIKPKTEGGLAGSDPANNAYESPFGWNRVNYFGDAGSTVTNTAFTQYNNGKSYRIYMPGYAEKDLLWAGSNGDKFGLFGNNLKAGSLRINPSLHYKINEKTTAIYEYRFSIGNGIFQSTSRFAWRGMKYDLHRIEVKNDKWFLRAYTLFDYGGNAYELGGIGNAMQGVRIDPDGKITTSANYFNAWNQVFAAARGTGFTAGNLSGVWQPNVDGGTATAFSLPTIQGNQSIENAAKLAYQLTNTLQIPANSLLFNQIRDKVANGVGDLKINGATIKGAAFANNARDWHLDGQRNFQFKNTDVVVGASYRYYLLKSNGTLISDGDFSPLGQAKREGVSNYEMGVFSQIQHSLLDKKLKISLAGRLDNFKNFGTRFSPRISAVYSTGNHNFRANFSSAYRAPAQLDQCIYLDYTSLLLIGGGEHSFQGLDASTLKPITVNKLKTEQANSWEIGYKSLIGNNLQVDVSYYQSVYNNFIGSVKFYGREDGIMPTGDFTTKTGDWAKTAPDRTRGRFIQTWTNADNKVSTNGFLVSADYRFNKNILLYGNYNYATISTVTNLIAGWNTPKHKFNIGANGLIIKQLTYSMNYRWNSTYTYYMPFDEGEIKAFGTIDAQLTYQVPTFKTTFKIGGTNLTNTNAIYVYGAAPISRIVYAGVSFKM